MFVIRYFASLLASIDWKRWVCEEGRSTFTQKCDLIIFLFFLFSECSVKKNNIMSNPTRGTLPWDQTEATRKHESLLFSTTKE